MESERPKGPWGAVLIRVAINGFGTIGKRVADAVDAQDDMEVAGVTKTGPSFGCDLAVRKGFPLYCTHDDSDRIAAFAEGGYECQGGLSDLLASADVVVDCAPGKRGAENLPKYKAAGIKHIFQGGEKHDLTGLSYTSCANHNANLDATGTRVVSCNTTGLSRTLVPLFEACGSLKVECTMIRRAADPGDSSKGPINAIKPVLKVPSHHGPDLMTVKPEIEINSLAVAVPTTIMHVHAIIADLPSGHGMTTESILELWGVTPRVLLMSGSGDRLTTTAEVMEMARDIGRKWGDLHEVFVWEDAVSLMDDRLYYFQAIHQESDVIPENIDCIRALTGIESDWKASVSRTDEAISRYYGM
ncbi:MAG: type II glyceraldehyde-3-phosphate dehydrogenase [Candidatus Thermoplasmatota archaeon]|nr:type II glyceraldehyde-3-phosphate dehydrogenase [Candidatus Thermoplasmatota archaeon]MEE3269761.1 type II glyceraldehyde-3-phosphate dehydrogenase [Candidatus Thermoplasmatota archaeon]